MTEDDIKEKLKGYVDNGGDDAVLPAVLLSLLASQKQIEKRCIAIGKRQDEQEKSAKKRMKILVGMIVGAPIVAIVFLILLRIL